MRSYRRDRRGLSEIVGTLMLIVIVVTAATLLAAFVSSYEKQVLAEEAQSHDRTLETGHVSSIEVCSTMSCPGLYCYDGNTPPPNATACKGQYLPSPIASLVATGKSFYGVVNVSFVSGDIQDMNFSDYLVNGQPPVGWMFLPHGSTPTWMSAPEDDMPNWSGCTPTTTYNGSTVAANASCAEVPAYGEVNLTLILDTNVTAPVSLSIYSSLAVTFSFYFVPPVALVDTTVLPVGSAYEPLFDGASSYQPTGGDNASIVQYSWSFYDKTTKTSVVFDPPYVGPEIEVSNLSSTETTDTFAVTLTVTNSDGLSSSTSVIYTG